MNERSDVGELALSVQRLTEGTSALQDAMQTLQRQQDALHVTNRAILRTAQEQTILTPRRNPRSFRRELAISSALLGLCVLLSAVWFWRSQPFDPLDNTRQQQVITRVPGFNGPAVMLGGELSVQGTKCNRLQQPVAVSGVVTWVSTDPAGTLLRTGEGAAVRKPGCQTRTYINPMPRVVLGRTKELFAEGYGEVQWQIVGVETPTGHDRAVNSSWRTEPFTVLPPSFRR